MDNDGGTPEQEGPTRDASEASNATARGWPREYGPMLAAIAVALGGSGFSWVRWGSPRAASVVLVAIGVVQTVNSLLRWKLGHREISRLRQSLRTEVMLGCLFPLTVGAVGLLTTPPLGVQIALAVVVLVAGVVVAIAEIQIAKVIAEDPRRISVTRYIASCTLLAYLVTGERTSIEEALRGVSDARFIPSLGWVFKPIWGSPVSGARYLMIVALLLPGVALAFGGTAQSDEHDPTTETATQPTPVRPATPATGGGTSGPSPSTPASIAPRTPSASPTPTRSTTCTGVPGASAPSWMQEDIAMLFVGAPGSARKLHATPPPGVADTCSRTETVPGADGLVVTTQWDRVTGQIRSVAVLSLAMGPALYIAPAAQMVLRLIREYGVLGGPPRQIAGPGDCYLVRIPARGTLVLIRRQFTRGAGLTEPFMVLPVAVAVAWRDQMREHEHWLWPVLTVRPGGSRVYELVDRGFEQHSAIKIEYDPDSEIARTTVGQELRVYGPDGAWLDETEIGTLAESAG